jgi:hypothetical protein
MHDDAKGLTQLIEFYFYFILGSVLIFYIASCPKLMHKGNQYSWHYSIN